MTLAELRAMARAKADEQSTGFIGDSELDTFINQGYRTIYSKLIQQFQDYFISKGTSGNGGLISVVADTNEYSLPTTMQKLVMAESRASGDTNENNWIKLPRSNIGNNQTATFFPVREGGDQGFGYFIAGTKVYLRPVPSSAFSLRLWFIPRMTELSAVSDEPTVPEEYHEMIAEYASMCCLAKSGEGIWKEMSEMFKLSLQELLDTSAHRIHEPEQMIITDDNDYSRGPY